MIEEIISPRFQEILKSKTSGDINNVDAELSELIISAIFVLTTGNLVWLAGENENFREKEKKLRLWLKLMKRDDATICFHKLPFQDPYINNSPDSEALSEKIQLISGLRKQKRMITISTLAALSIRIEDQTVWADMTIGVNDGERLNRNDFIKKCSDLGYRPRDFVNEKGDISWRGSIVDIFPLNEDNPVRVEFLGGEVKSIRYFDNSTQKSIRGMKCVSIPMARYFFDQEIPANYFLKQPGHMATLIDLMGEHRLVSSDFRKIRFEYRTLLKNFEKLHTLKRATSKNIPSLSKIFDIRLSKEQVLNINEISEGISSEFEINRIRKSIMEFDRDDIGHIEQKIKAKKYKCYICSENRQVSERVLPFWRGAVPLDFNIPFSIENRVNHTLFLTFKNFYFSQREYRAEDELSQTDQLLNTIKENDLVVHKQHGIGRYVGIRKLEIGGLSTEFVQIEYLNREFLYVPVYELNILSRYMAFEGYQPGLDKLGGKSWQSKQSRARKSIMVFARELLELYALRKSIRGYSHAGDYDLENRLVQGFRFVETRDQKIAIREVLRDLESDFPMDRLICGDVSFGKTEVAVRAAFRVVLNGKQVAVLCPTTILAWQHFETFKNRFSSFPVNVALLTRMVPGRKRKEICANLEAGQVDVVVGTHSLLSRKINFKQLGLLVIDEEQRFGVFQKERLKKDRVDIDVLSLSATPIPRTLSLGLSGLQDISIIQSPPIGRLAVKNYVGYFTKEIVLSAILNEIERDGLVYIVYNRIDRIFAFKDDIQSWLPGISMTVIHAQMSGEDIEKNLLDFIEKKYRILVSTTIIENGIDIPDVNTLIVVNAEQFGLTQLYQLRGRIGRGSRQGYAFFLINNTDITEKAQARLRAIREFADLGSGYRLAEFDLKLRGMGSLLGNRQHGHIEALGYDYYLEILNQLIKELKGEEEKKWESRIKINFSYSIDSEYISDSSERIRYYKKILDAGKASELIEIKNELIDRFGPHDEGMEKIFFVALIRILANRHHLENVEVFEDRLEIMIPEIGMERDGPIGDFLKKLAAREIRKHTYEAEIKNFRAAFEAFSRTVIDSG
jgi:transcription-repair coupling factor (superfamily II helicase)